LIDKDSLNLTPRANDLLDAGKFIKNLKQEFYLSTVEICTDKRDDVHQIKDDLKLSFEALTPIGNDLGIRFSTTGCHPFARYSDCVITPSKRYIAYIHLLAHCFNDNCSWFNQVQPCPRFLLRENK